MRSPVFAFILFFNSLPGFSQEKEIRMQMTGSAAVGLNSILGSYYSGVFSNTVYGAGTLGIRKSNSDFSFMGFAAGYSERGIRINRYFGNSFLPEKNNSYTNRYASLQYFIGKYIHKSSYVKAIIGTEYLFQSDQYDFKNTTYYRSVNRLTPSLELSWGKDFKLSSGLKGYLELTSGVLVLRPNFFHSGVRIGFFFTEKEADGRTY